MASLCVVGAAAGLTAAPAGALPKSFYGVNLVRSLSDRDVERMANGGVGTARFSINWPTVQPQRQAPLQWAATDATVGALARGGIRALPTLAGNVGWLKHGGRPPVGRPGARRAWRSFVRAAALRYGPGGAFWTENPGLPRRPVRYWQIYNETNFPAYWRPKVSAKAYVGMLRSSAKALRRVSSRINVVLAGLGPGLARRRQVPCWRYLEQLYRHGAKPYFDVVGDHPYALNATDALYQVRRVAKVMRRNHDGQTPLWLDEAGWSSGHYPGFRLAIGPRGQAKRLRQMFRRVRANAAQLGVTRLFWFDLRDPSVKLYNCGSCFNFGLIRRHGKPKPSWHAFTGFAKR